MSPASYRAAPPRVGKQNITRPGARGQIRSGKRDARHTWPTPRSWCPARASPWEHPSHENEAHYILGRRHAHIFGLSLSILGIAYLVLLVAAAPIAWQRARRLPVWTLLPLGLLVSLLIFRLGTAVAPQAGPLGMLLPLGVIILLLAIGGVAARQHNVLALLVVIGGYVYMFTDNDTLWGSPYRDWPGLPFYLPAMIFLFFVLAPIGLLRTKTRLGQAIALFLPATIFLTARLAVPALVLGEAYTIRPGDVFISATVLLSLVAGWLLYGRVGSPTSTKTDPVISTNGAMRNP